MTKTVILLNPYGTDVTNFVNGTPGVPQLLNGTIMSPGDTLYTLPYDWTVSGISNINAGVTLLDAKLNATSGEILVFGYSEGCQIADKWLTTDGPTSSISPTVLSFLLIGNADRKYGGFCYNQAAFDPVAWTGGKPADTAYTVTDFTRQYDPIGDFPNATAIVDALDALEAVTAGPNVLNEAMQSVADVVASTVDSTAALNALAGLLLIHIDYLSVAVSDAGNVSLVEGNITWVWSPTYPIPLLGVSTLSPRSDLQTRPVIEDAFDRPVSLPLPDYGALILALAPDWATQVPSAPVQQTPGKAFQITQPSSQQVQSMQSQLLQSVWQAFVQIVDGFLDLGTEPSAQLAQWNTDFQTAITTAQTDITTLAADGTASLAATSTFWQAAGTAITTWISTHDFPTLVSTVAAAWNTYMAAETTLTSGAWATIQQLLGVVGIDITTGNNIQWAAVMSQITALQTLLASPPVSAADWASWWTTTLEDLGVGSTDATNTANFLSGNYSTALNANAWVTRLLTDLTVVVDLLHFTYQPGTSSDAPGTLGTNGKPTWWSAVNDVLALFHIATTVTAPASGGSTPGQIIAANTTAASVASAAATTAGTNASIAIASSQATKDAIVTATTGAPVTGSTDSQIVTGLTNFPATNVVGGTGAAVTFGAVGGGDSTDLSGATSGSISWTHTIATGDLIVLVFTAYSVPIGQTESPTSVTYGGTAMTLLQRQASSVSGGAAYAVTEAWVLKAPPSGSKTVIVSVSGANFDPVSGDSVSYSASKVGTVGPNSGGGSSSLSMSAASATGKIVVGAFGVSTNFTALPTLSAYSQTQRYNSFGLVLGDAAGASSVAFGATASGTASLVQWAGITVELEN